MDMCQEMIKFRKILEDNSIPYEDCSDEHVMGNIDMTMHRTRFYYKGNNWSVINGFGSYGGVNVLDSRNQGLLEIWNRKSDPEGFLTADEVWEKINV